jgi:hypothetical protein
VNLFRLGEGRPPATEVLAVLREKCRFKGIELPSLPGLAIYETELRADWAGMLRHQLAVLPPFEAYWEPLAEFFAWLATGFARPAPAPIPVEKGARMLRLSLGSLGASGIAHAKELEKIRFAAASRLCVDLGYQGSVRRIEPYSLRRSTAGDVLLMAVRSDNGENRTYRVDEIESARVTTQVFTPRYAVELATPELAIRPFAATRSASGMPARTPRAPASHKGVSRPGDAAFVFRCAVCGKRFKRSTFDGSLNAHRMPNGLPCPSRIGLLVSRRQ